MSLHLQLVFPAVINYRNSVPTIKVESRKVLPSGRFQPLPANIRLGWKQLTGTNTLDCNDTELIKAGKT